MFNADNLDIESALALAAVLESTTSDQTAETVVLAYAIAASRRARRAGCEKSVFIEACEDGWKVSTER